MQKTPNWKQDIRFNMDQPGQTPAPSPTEAMSPEEPSSFLWLENASMALVCFGTVFVETPFVRIYESVLCCQLQGRDCPFGGLEDENLCRDNKTVQTQLMEINTGLVFWGALGKS